MVLEFLRKEWYNSKDCRHKKEVKKDLFTFLWRRGKERKMGKIKVESCEIEGLKVITPTVFRR